MSDAAENKLGMKIKIKDKTDLEGFEPPTSGLEARRYILAKPQIQQILRYKVAFMDDKMNGWDIILHDNETGELLPHRWALPIRCLPQTLPSHHSGSAPESAQTSAPVLHNDRELRILPAVSY